MQTGSFIFEILFPLADSARYVIKKIGLFLEVQIIQQVAMIVSPKLLRPISYLASMTISMGGMFKFQTISR
jgi:hypothetical protein